MLDLSKQDPSKVAEAGFEFNIVLPDGTETEGKVKVRGKNSKVVQQFNRKLLQEMQATEQANRRRGKQTDMTPEDAEDLACRIAVNRIITWSGLGKDGKEIPFDPVTAEDILREYPFLREQVMLESDNLLNFRHGND